MADAKRCDRCGKYYQRKNDKALRVLNRDFRCGESVYDLCDDCTTDLDKFMKGEFIAEPVKFLD